jgi:GTP-binding protein
VLSTRVDLRNVAIVAHVDHGKTTLVDAMLRQTGVFRVHQEVTDRVMDSMDLEREKGITILAKNASVHVDGVKINIVDTPGHADFGGEVERGLTMVDGVLLLVDASEGPLPQTRFVLRKALEARLPVVVVVNKVDRADARIDEVVHEVEELFLDLDADEHQIDFPIVYCNARTGRSSLDADDPALRESGAMAADGLQTLFKVLLDHIPAPTYDDTHPLQAQVTNLDASPYLGRLALCRVHHGTLVRNQPIAWCRADGTMQTVRISSSSSPKDSGASTQRRSVPGEIGVIAGLADVTIGETLTALDDPRPLPVMHIDDPSLAMTIGINTSPLAGLDGDKLTARLVKNRLDAEVVGNVSLRVLPGERPDAWEVQGRGELQLAILVETMRREGFELTVGKPEVVTRLVGGKVHEPVDRVAIDVPEEFLGTGHAAPRDAQGSDGADREPRHGVGTARVPRSRTRARGLPHRVPHRDARHRAAAPRVRAVRAVARRAAHAAERVARVGPARRDHGYTLLKLQDRGELLVGPGVETYEGMVVGESSRAGDMDVNPTKEKQLTNHRAAAADDFERLAPPRPMSLEQALEFIATDECVEVTPKVVRIRKVTLDATTRGAAPPSAPPSRNQTLFGPQTSCA